MSDTAEQLGAYPAHVQALFDELRAVMKRHQLQWVGDGADGLRVGSGALAATVCLAADTCVLAAPMFGLGPEFTARHLAQRYGAHVVEELARRTAQPSSGGTQ